jgi:hypothetical protein
MLLPHLSLNLLFRHQTRAMLQKELQSLIAANIALPQQEEEEQVEGLRVKGGM